MNTIRSLRLLALASLAIGGSLFTSSCYYPVGSGAAANRSDSYGEIAEAEPAQTEARPVVSVTPVVVGYPFYRPYFWGPRYYPYYRSYYGPRYYGGHHHHRHHHHRHHHHR